MSFINMLNEFLSELNNYLAIENMWIEQRHMVISWNKAAKSLTEFSFC